MQKQSKKNAAFMAALHNKLAQVDNLDSMRNNREKSMQALLLLDEWQTSQHPLPDTRMMKEFRTTMKQEQQTTNGKMPWVTMLTPMVRHRMALGDILQSISVRSIASNVSGMGSYISTYFESTSTQPQYKTNREWNDPINKNANGMFWVYYQNVHGVPRDDATLGQDLQTLASFHIGCLCFSETNLDWNRSYVKHDFLSRQ
jgi:hypothetical protein